MGELVRAVGVESEMELAYSGLHQLCAQMIDRLELRVDLAEALARNEFVLHYQPIVEVDTGTGLVHIAPGHGEEDYELGRKAGLKIVREGGRVSGDYGANAEAVKPALIDGVTPRTTLRPSSSTFS